MVALDVMEKAAAMELWQVELNDLLGTCLKIRGQVDAVEAAIAAGHRAAEQMGGHPVSRVMARPSPQGEQGIYSPLEFNPLIEQYVVKHPDLPPAEDGEKRFPMSSDSIRALGFIETQGFTAVFEAVDTACKTAQVEVVGKEKLGGGYVTIVIQGDVAAVHAAIAAARPKVEGLGKLIAAHVIARPSPSVLALLPK